jgi:hypothetical protein
VTFRLRRKVIPSQYATRDLRKICVKFEGAKAPIVILSCEAAKDRHCRRWFARIVPELTSKMYQ